jgi:EmrB/QacA subfamily drug resistance transporter
VNERVVEYPVARPNDPAAADGIPGAYPWKVLTVTTLGSLLVFVNSTSVNVALPSISSDFGVQAATADWFLLSFMLSLTGLVLIFSRISDMVGRRRLYLGGLLLMTLASAGAVFATGPAALILFRTLQGIAAAAIITNANAQIADAFPQRLLGVGLSINIMMASVASMLGPAIGGLLLEAFGWRSLFIVNIPFGVLGLALGLMVLRKEAPRAASGAAARFDYAGAVLSALGLAALMFGINRLSAWGWADPRALGLLVLAVTAFAVFGAVEKRVREPLVDFALIRDRARGLAYATAFLMSFAQASVLVLVVLYQQLVLGVSPAETGLVAAVSAASVMLASPLAGQLTRWFSSRSVSTAGALISFAGYVVLTTCFTDGPDSGLLIPSLALIGAGNGIFTAPNTAAVMGGLASNKRGISNGIRSVLYNAAQTMGTAVVLLILGQWLTAAGINGYSGVVASDKTVIGGFLVAGLLLVVCTLLAVICSAARGGPWRAGHYVRPGSPKGLAQ